MLTDLHKAIVAQLKKDFRKVPTCEAYPELVGKIVIPALFIELDDLAPTDDVGTEQLPVDARFITYVVYDRTVDDDRLQAASLAASVALAVKKAGRFGRKIGPARVVRIAQDTSKPELFGFTVWAVEWLHELRLGESIWDGDGVVPVEVMLGYAPQIGTGHEDDYLPVTEVPSG